MTVGLRAALKTERKSIEDEAAAGGRDAGEVFGFIFELYGHVGVLAVDTGEVGVPGHARQGLLYARKRIHLVYALGVDPPEVYAAAYPSILFHDCYKRACVPWETIGSLDDVLFLPFFLQLHLHFFSYDPI